MKIKENGRSMVEMLGVLAIIGVLSAGALSGFNKAMFKHKMNQTIVEVNNIFQRWQELDSQMCGENIGVEECQNIVEKRVLAQYYVKQDESDYKVPIGSIYIQAEVLQGRLVSNVWIYFEDGNNVNECITLLSHHWETFLPQEWFANGGFIGIDYPERYELYGWGGNAIKNGMISMDEIIKACGLCEGSRCDVTFAIRGYL